MTSRGPVAGAGLLLLTTLLAFAQIDSAHIAQEPQSAGRDVLPARAHRPAAATPSPQTPHKLLSRFAALPLSFAANQGQTDGRVKFLAHGPHYSLFLTGNEAVLALESRHPRGRALADDAVSESPAAPATRVLRMRLLGANPSPEITGLQMLPGKSNYLLGRDAAKWRINVPNFAQVHYENVYPGVDLLYYGSQGRLEYDFVLEPGSDASQIQFGVEGAQRLEVDAGGNLVLHLDSGNVILHQPAVYQLEGKERRELRGKYVLLAGERVGFQIIGHDASKRLVIDPVLSYSTYLGGSGTDEALAIAVDANGNAYITGDTSSPDFPGANPAAVSSAFVAELSSSGVRLFSTYIGGSSGFTQPTGIGVDVNGNIYVVGFTDSTNLPVTAGALQGAAPGGGNDGFAMSLKPNGAGFNYVTYLGGGGSDLVTAVAVDRTTGTASIAGQTTSSNFLTGNVIAGTGPKAGGMFTTTNAGTTWASSATGLTNPNISAIAVNPATPTTVYAATQESGVIRGTTSGSSGSWAQSNSGLTNLFVRALIVDPVTPTTLYAGTGHGVFVSTNSAGLWTAMTTTGMTNSNLHTLAIDRSANLYAGSNAGVFKSSSGGAWSFVSSTIPADIINTLVIDPTDPTIVYAGTANHGVWKGTSGGTVWTQLGSNFTTAQVTSLAIDPTAANLYAATRNAGVLAINPHTGITWATINNGLPFAVFFSVVVDPTSPSTVYVSTNNAGIFKTTNSGGLWTATDASLSNTRITALAIDPTTSSKLYAGSSVIDSFVTRLNSSGGLVYSTYLGGNGAESANGIAVDNSGNAYIAGFSNSRNYPTLNAAQSTLRGGLNTVVTKINSTPALVYSTYWGGSGTEDQALGIAADNAGNAYVTGVTNSTDMTVQNAFQSTLKGTMNAYVLKLNSGGGVVYSTYLGGESLDQGNAIALDGNGNAWVAGQTNSEFFPLANGTDLELSDQGSGRYDAFVSEFGPNGNLMFSTYLGAEGDDIAYGIGVDSANNVYVAGSTTSFTFPTVAPAQAALAGSMNTFITKFGFVANNADMSVVLDPTFSPNPQPNPVLAGAPITFKLVVTNNGPATANNVVLGGRGGGHSEAITCTVSQGSCSLNGNVGPANNGFAYLGSMAAGSSANVTVVLRPRDPGTFPVEVEVRADENDPNAANNNAATSFTVLPAADLSVVLDAQPNNVNVGQLITYTATILNLGPSPATGVTFSANLPAGAGSPQMSPALSCQANFQNCTVPGPLNPGQAFTILITATANSIPLTTTVTAGNTVEPDFDPSNNSATVTSNATERMLLTERFTGAVSVLNLADGSLVEGPIPAGITAGSTVLSPNRRLAFVGNLNATYISAIDTTIGREMRRIQGAREARNMALSADGTALFVPDLDRNDLTIIDTRSLDVLAHIDLTQFTGPNTTVTPTVGTVLPLGSAVLVNDISNSGIGVVGVDLRSFKTASLFGQLQGASSQWAALAAMPDFSLVFNIRQGPPNLYILDPTLLNSGLSVVAKTIPWASRPVAIGVTPNGSNPNNVFGYVVRVDPANPATNVIVDVIDLRRTGNCSAGITATGCNFGQPIAGATVTLTLTNVAQQLFRIAVSHDGSRLVIAGGGATSGDNVFVLDTGLMRTSPGTAILQHFHLGSGLSWVTGLALGFAETQADVQAPLAPPSNLSLQVPNPNPVLPPNSVVNSADTPITITGQNIGADAVVRIGKSEALIPTSNQGGTLTVVVPANLAAQNAADIIVTNPGVSGPVSAQHQSGLLAGQLNIVPSLAFHPLNELITANLGDATVSILDLRNRVTTKRTVGPQPLGLAITADGQRVYVDNFGFAVSVLDRASSTVNSFTLPASSNSGQADSVAISAPTSGSAVAFSNARVQTSPGVFENQVLRFDTSTAPFTNLITPTLSTAIGTAGTPGALAISPTGTFAYSADFGNGTIYVFDVAANTLAATLSTVTLGVSVFQPHMQVTPDGKFLLLVTDAGPIKVFDISGTVMAGSSPTNPLAISVEISGTAPPGGTIPSFGTFLVSGTRVFAYDSAQRLVQAFNFAPATPNFSQLGSFVIPGTFNEFFAGLGISPDGSLLYAGLPSDDAVAVLDANLLAGGSPNPLITKLAVGIGAETLAVSPATGAAEPDLSVVIGGPASPAPSNRSLTYNVTVSDALAAATGVTLTVTLHTDSTQATPFTGFSGNFINGATQGACSSSSGGTPVVVTVTCNLGALALNAQATASVTVTPTVAMNLTATAVVTENEIEFNLGNNSSSTVTQVADMPDLQVTITHAAPNPPVQNGNFDYQVTLNNLGATASNVTLTVQFPNVVLPSGLPQFSINTTGSNAPQACTEPNFFTVSCPVGTLANTQAGGAIVVSISGVPNAAGPMSITSTATESGTDANPADNSVSQNLTVVAPLADISVSTSSNADASGNIPVLNNLIYTFTVTNAGPSPATGVTFTTQVPAGTVFAGALLGGTFGTICPISGNTITCAIGTLVSGGSTSVQLTVIPLAPGTVSNSADAGASESDPTPGNNTSALNVNATGTAPPGGGAFRNLQGFWANQFFPNDDSSTGQVNLPFSINFVGRAFSSLFVNNNGNVTFPCVAGQFSDCGSLGTFTPFPLSGQQRVIIAPFFADVDTAGAGSGIVTYGTDTVNGRAAFAVNWPNVEYFPASDPTKLNLFQLVLIDRSDIQAGDFDLELNYDKVQWETGSASGGSGGLGGSSARAGYSNGVTVATADQAPAFFELPGSAINGAFLDSNNTTGLIHNSLNSAQRGQYVFQIRSGGVVSSADVEALISGPASATAGGNVVYNVTVINHGPNTATGVSLSDDLAFTITSGTPTLGAQSSAPGVVCSTSAPTGAGHLGLSCNLGDMASQAQVAITVTVGVPSAFAGQLTDTATANIPGTQDLNVGNNSRQAVTQVTAPVSADLQVSAAVNSSNPTTSDLTYTITVHNNGPSAASNVSLSDALTGSASFVSSNPGTPTCTISSGSNLGCNLGTINNGADATVTVTVHLSGTGWTSNDVSVTSTTPDPNPNNNMAPVRAQLVNNNTSTGSNITVQPLDATTGGTPASVTFATVTSSGSTTVTSVAAGPKEPAGFRPGTPAIYYDISTTAGYAGTIRVSLSFAGVSFHHPDRARLFHYENGGWVDRTVSANTASQIVTGVVASLSPFAVFEPLDGVPVANPGPDRVASGTSSRGAQITLDGSASSDPDHDNLTYRWTGPFPEGGGTVTGIRPVVTMPLGAGRVTLVVNDGEVDSAPVSQAVTVTDFSVAASANGATTINAGQAVSFTIDLAPQFGAYSSAVTLSCSGLPMGSQCQFSTASLTPGATQANATLTITTTGPSAAMAAPPRPGQSLPLYALWMPLPAVVLLGASRRRHSRKAWLGMSLLMVALLSLLLLQLVACGGGGGGGAPTPTGNPSTPTGSYSVIVTGTAGSLQHSTNAGFTVK